MTLNGSKLILLGNNGQVDKVLEPKEKVFRIGYYMSCDFIHEHPDVKGIHCEIVCDAFGRISIRNLSYENPISVNGCIVKGTRPLLSGNSIEVLGKQFRWMNGNEEHLKTPDQKEVKSEQPPKSEPSLKEQKLIQRRLTVHSFAYGLQTQSEDSLLVQNVEVAGNVNIEKKNNEKAECADNSKQSIKSRQSSGSIYDGTAPSQNLSTSENLENTLNFSKMSDIDKENETPKMKLSFCCRSQVVLTSYSPSTPGSKPLKNFAYITPIKTTPRSLYSTPKGVLSDCNRSADASNDIIDFKTPGTVKCVQSSMHLIDLTSPLKSKTPKQLKSNSLIKTVLKNSAKRSTKTVTKQTSLSTPTDSHSKLNKNARVTLGRNVKRSLWLLPNQKLSEELPETPTIKNLSERSVNSKSNKSQVLLNNLTVEKSASTTNFAQITLDSSSASTINVDSTDISDGSIIEISTDDISVENKRTPISIKGTPKKFTPLMRKAIITSARKVMSVNAGKNSVGKNQTKLNDSKVGEGSSIISENFEATGVKIKKRGSSGLLNSSTIHKQVQPSDRAKILASKSLNLGRSTPKRLTFTTPLGMSSNLATSTPLGADKLTPLKIPNKQGGLSGKYKRHSCVESNQNDSKVLRTPGKVSANIGKKTPKVVNKTVLFVDKLKECDHDGNNINQNLNATFTLDSEDNLQEELRNVIEIVSNAKEEQESTIFEQEEMILKETDNITTNISDINSEITQTVQRKCNIEENDANESDSQSKHEDKTQKDHLALENLETKDTSYVVENNLSNLKEIKEQLKTSKRLSDPLLLHSDENDTETTLNLKCLKTPNIHSEVIIDDPLVGIKKLLTTSSSSRNTTVDLCGIKELMKTPKETHTFTDNLVGIKELMKTPKKSNNMNDNFVGLKELVKTPRNLENDNALLGIHYILRTPRNDEFVNNIELKEWIKTPITGQNDLERNMSMPQSPKLSNFNKGIDDESVFKTPSAKMAMVLGTPQSMNVNIERNSEELTGPTVYDLRENMEEIEDIFQTPGVSKLSKFIEDRDNENEILTAEESFDKLVRRPCIKRSYSRKSISPKMPGVFVQSTVKDENILAKTDVEEWVEKVSHLHSSEKCYFNDEINKLEKDISNQLELEEGISSVCDEPVPGDVSGINMLDSTKGSEFSCDLVYSDDELSEFDNFLLVPSLKGKRPKSCTPKRVSISQENSRKYRKSVGSKPLITVTEKEKQNSKGFHCKSHQKGNSINNLLLNKSLDEESEQENEFEHAYTNEPIDKSLLYLETSGEERGLVIDARERGGKSLSANLHKHVTKVLRKSVEDNSNNVPLYIVSGKESLELEDALKNVNKITNLRSTRGRSVNETVYKDVSISPKSRTMGNDTLYMSFDLEDEREKYEMAQVFENFETTPIKGSTRSKSVGEITSKNILIKPRKTMGNEAQNVSFDTEIEKGRIEMENVFKNFNEKPNNKGTRGRSVGESTFKGGTLKKTRKTMHNASQDVSFDIENEKERIEMENAFKNFNEKPSNKGTRGRSVGESTLKGTLKKTRKTMHNASQDVSFDIETEKERIEMENAFKNFKEKPNNKPRGKSVGESTFKGTPKKTRKTMHNASQDVSFDIETEKERIEMENAFKDFNEKPNNRGTRGKSVGESTLKGTLKKTRKTMHNVSQDVSFDIETEKERIEREKAFENFDDKPTTRGLKGKSINVSELKHTLIRSRKTMGNFPEDVVSFDIDTEKERLEKEEAFKHFEKSPISRSIRGRSLVASTAFMNKNTLTRHRKTMSNLSNNVSFDVEVEKERVDTEQAFENFDQKPTIRGPKGRSINTLALKKTSLKLRKTMNSACHNVSFDIEIEKERVETEKAFENFIDAPLTTYKRARSSLVPPIIRSQPVNHRKTMGSQTQVLPFNVEMEKERLQIEKAFENFEEKSITRGSRGKSTDLSSGRSTMVKSRKTMGHERLNLNVSFDIETEKDRVEIEKAFENFNENPTTRGIRGQSLNKLTLKSSTPTKPRKTLGHAVQHLFFDVKAEKERLEMRNDFENLDENLTTNGTRDRSITESIQNIPPNSRKTASPQNVPEIDNLKANEFDSKDFEGYNQDSSLDDDYSFLDSNIKTKQYEMSNFANSKKSLSEIKIGLEAEKVVESLPKNSPHTHSEIKSRLTEEKVMCVSQNKNNSISEHSETAKPLKLTRKTEQELKVVENYLGELESSIIQHDEVIQSEQIPLVDGNHSSNEMIISPIHSKITLRRGRRRGIGKNEEKEKSNSDLLVASQERVKRGRRKVDKEVKNETKNVEIVSKTTRRRKNVIPSSNNENDNVTEMSQFETVEQNSQTDFKVEVDKIKHHELDLEIVSVKNESINTSNNVLLLPENIKSTRSRKKKIEFDKEVQIIKDNMVSVSPINGKGANVDVGQAVSGKEKKTLETTGKLRGRGRRVEAIEKKVMCHPVIRNEPDGKDKVELSNKETSNEGVFSNDNLVAVSEAIKNTSEVKNNRGGKLRKALENEEEVSKLTDYVKVHETTDVPKSKLIRRGKRKIVEDEVVPVVLKQENTKNLSANIENSEFKSDLLGGEKSIGLSEVKVVTETISLKRERRKKNEIDEEKSARNEITGSSEIDIKTNEVEMVQKKSYSNRKRRNSRANQETKETHEDGDIKNILEISSLNLQTLESREEVEIQAKRGRTNKIIIEEVEANLKSQATATKSQRPKRGIQEKKAVSQITSQAKTEVLEINEENIDEEIPTNVRVTRKRGRKNSKDETTNSSKTIEKEIVTPSGQTLALSKRESQDNPRKRHARKISNKENDENKNLSAQKASDVDVKKGVSLRSRNIRKVNGFSEISADDLTPIKPNSKALAESNKNSTQYSEDPNIVEFKTPINVVLRARRCLRSNSTHISTPVLSEVQEQISRKDVSEGNKSVEGNHKSQKETPTAKRGRRRINSTKEVQGVDTDEQPKGNAGKTQTRADRRKKEVDIDVEMDEIQSKKKSKLETKSSTSQINDNEAGKTERDINNTFKNSSENKEELINSEKVGRAKSTRGKRKILETNFPPETEEIATKRTTRSRKK